MKKGIKMKEKRELNIIFTRGGSGSISPKLAIPKKWIDQLKITENDKMIEAEITENNEIIIRKKGE